MITRPLPVPDAISAPYWTAAASHQLTAARCSHCGTYTMPPEAVCTTCGSTDPRYTFRPIDGTGTICSWTVVRQCFLPGFDVPFVLVDVGLNVQPGLRMIGRLVDGPGADVGLGVSVRVAFEDLTTQISIPAFELAR